MTRPRPDVTAAPGRGGDRPRGLALVMVLWVLVLLSVIAAGFTATTRTEMRLVANLVDGARAEAHAEAGVCRAILALLEPDETHHWRADGTVYTVPFEGGEVLISIQDESGKIDLNQAPPELLRGLFISIGLDELEADALKPPSNNVLIIMADSDWQVVYSAIHLGLRFEVASFRRKRSRMHFLHSEIATS